MNTLLELLILKRVITSRIEKHSPKVRQVIDNLLTEKDKRTYLNKPLNGHGWLWSDSLKNKTPDHIT